MSAQTQVRGKLWEGRGRFVISRLIERLEEHGFRMHRGHAKDSGSGGRKDTRQVMVVFDRPTVEYTEEQRAHNALTAFSEEERAELIERFFPGLGYLVTIYGNDAIARVPPHVYVKCGMPKPAAEGAPVLDIEEGDFIQGSGRDVKNVTFWDVLKAYDMVRLSLNILPHLEHWIPEWLERRERHERKESVSSIGDAIGRL